jgi:CheY-like chemotaxis protein
VRLHQVIINLVSNAVKFTNTGSITVSTRLLSQDEEKVSIEFGVTDTGIGIEESKQEDIFQTFRQATSGTSRLFGGTGLGLAIVKQLVEPQGGSVHVKSKKGEGSTFSFVLSFLKTKEGVSPEEEISAQEMEIGNIEVLVAEDMALNQLLMKTLLDDFGFGCTLAVNGRIAIEIMKERNFDIVLMDLQMPEMNGFETTEYIRSKMKSTIPIIALTADVTTVDLEKCKAVGMNDYIAKPVDERVLYRKIISLVRKTADGKLTDLVGPPLYQEKSEKCIDLDYLMLRTKSNPELMLEIITLYLKQTPTLVNAMKQSLNDRDWKSLDAAVHKMIPSFSIMGIDSNYEKMAVTVQKYAKTQMNGENIPGLLDQIERICGQACQELEEECVRIKNNAQ